MSLEFTLVRRAISLAVIDGPDTDDNPDILKAQGSVLFEPVIKKGDSIQVQTRGGSETYALAPIECPINDGIISHRGQDGVKLPAGGEAANPSLIRWKATFSRMQAGGKAFTLAPVVFDAVPGGEIDLTMVAPVAGAPEGVVRGPRGTSLESIIVDGSELVFTAVDDAGSFEIARIPLDEMVRAEADAAADGVRDALAADVAASQSARDAAQGHANRAATSESNAAASESAAKQSETNAGDYAAVATTAATEAVDAMDSVSDIIGAKYATQEYVDASKWYRGYAKPSDTIDTLTPGWWGVPSSLVAESLDLPVIMIGDVHVVDIGNVRRIQYSTNEGTKGQQIWIIAKTNRGEWGTWRKVFPVEEPKIPSMTKGSAGALKTVPLALTTGHGNSGNGAASGSFRVPIEFKAPIIRWRLALSNRNPRFGNIHRTTATISKIVLGKDEGAGKLSAPKTVATSIIVPDSGDVVYTRWVNSPIDEAMLLAFKYTSTGTDAPPRLLGGGWNVGSADPADESVTGTRVSYLPFDMWLEVETNNRTPVIAAFGDSLSSGANADLPVYESWLSQYARRIGALPVHYTQSGDTAKSWASSFTSYKWLRWEHLDLPDAVIYQLGSNDLSASGDGVETLKASTVTAIDHIREVMTDNIYAGTITPRTSWDSSTETERTSYNNWLNTLPVGIRDVFDVAAAVGDGANIKAEFDADGTHLNTAGYDAWQAAIDRPVVSARADVLAAYNQGKGL